MKKFKVFVMQGVVIFEIQQEEEKKKEQIIFTSLDSLNSKLGRACVRKAFEFYKEILF